MITRHTMPRTQRPGADAGWRSCLHATVIGAAPVSVTLDHTIWMLNQLLSAPYS